MREVSRRQFLQVGASMALVSGCKKADRPRLSFDQLIDCIGQATSEQMPAVIDDLRRRATPLDALLAAAWLAPLRWGGLPQDSHVIMMISAVSGLGHDESVRPAVEWAVTASNAWCQHSRHDPPVAAATTSRDWLSAAIDAQDELEASAHAVAACREGRAQEALAALRDAGSQVRGDPHAAIYVAQTTRAFDLIPVEYQYVALSHLAAFMARSKASEGRETASANARPSLDSNSFSSTSDNDTRAIFDDLARQACVVRRLDTLSGGDVHATTHLDAMLFLHRVAAPRDKASLLVRTQRSMERWQKDIAASPAARRAAPATQPTAVVSAAEALSASSGDESLSLSASAATRDLAGFRSEVRRRTIANAADEHAFKYLAAADHLTPLVSRDVAVELWSGFALSPACKRSQRKG